MQAFTCGVHEQHCTGGECVLSHHLRKQVVKVHNSPDAAFNCHARYLMNVLGYTRRGPREFAPPDGGPIRVLTKKSRFGGRLRGGKKPQGTKGRRVMPEFFTGGVVASY